MAQYDILLTQNVAAAGTEFSEQYVNISKGDILSGDASGTPTVLSAGTDGYMLVRDAATSTGLNWQAIAAGHTQNTDTGTTNNTFTIDNDSTDGKMVLDVQNGGTNNTLTLQNSVLDGDYTITFPNATGTVALTSQLHTQNTDTGTTQTSFDIDSGGTGVKLKNSTGELQLRNLADSGYANLRVNDLVVEGTTTTINSTTLTVDDKNIELGSVGTPTDTTADGGGITLKGATDKTIIWDNANDNWTLNQNVNIPTGTVYKINNTEVLSATQVLGVTLGTMAAETATDYVANALFDANTILFATSDNTPAALLGTELPPKIWAEAPADKIGTGYTGTAIAGQVARDDNWFYVCKTGGTATNQAWLRSPLATNW